MQLSTYPVKPISITTMDDDNVARALMVQGVTGTSNQTWRAAKRVRYIPFSIEHWYHVATLGWFNVAASGSVDAGLMDGSGNRMYHVGTATAQSPSNGMQTVSPGIWLPPGNFYFALSLDNTTGSFRGYTGANGLTPTREAGVLEETTGSFGIPSIFTPVTITNSEVPWMFIADDTTLTF